jgi:hypothetical protein
MGASSSRTCPNGVIEKIDPKPDEGYLRGVSISGAKECARCVFEIPPNISSSSVTISRERTVDTCPTGFSELATQCTKGSITLKKNVPENQAVGSKAILKPSIPLQFKFNGTTYNVPEMTLYHPCPFAIENVQADAVLVLVSDNAMRVMIPIQSGATEFDFLNSIASSLSSLRVDETTGQYLPVTVPTGHSWDLTKAVPVDKEGHVTTGYFLWKKVLYKQKVVEGSCVRRITWEPVSQEGGHPNYMMVETPMIVSQDTLANILGSLPAADAKHAEPPIPSEYVYKGRKCKTCKVDTAKLIEQINPQTDSTTLMTFLWFIGGIFGGLLLLAFTFWASGKIYTLINGPILTERYYIGLAVLAIVVSSGIAFGTLYGFIKLIY